MAELSDSSTWLRADDLIDLLSTGSLEIEGRLADASNMTVRCTIDAGDRGVLRCVVKPVAGERPLWDFPEWTLTRREIASYALSELLGWAIVPPTVWREDGPGGSGMCQLWIDADPAAVQVDATRPGRRPAGWLHVLDAEDGAGRPVELTHAPRADLQRVAAFDVIANNADRKAGHLLTDDADRIWGIDHGVTFNAEPKLRTVLWGWAGEPVPDAILADLDRARECLSGSYDDVDRWLDDDERDALRRRLTRLLATARFPRPGGRWPAIPWPVF